VRCDTGGELKVRPARVQRAASGPRDAERRRHDERVQRSAQQDTADGVRSVGVDLSIDAINHIIIRSTRIKTIADNDCDSTQKATRLVERLRRLNDSSFLATGIEVGAMISADRFFDSVHESAARARCSDRRAAALQRADRILRRISEVAQDPYPYYLK